MWYPMHVDVYVNAMKGKDMLNFLLPKTVRHSSIATPLSDLMYSDSTRVIVKNELAKYVKGIQGHVLFVIP